MLQSKQLKNVFMEAKIAYRERKAEIVADRKARAGLKQDKDLRRADLRIDDSRSEQSNTSARHRSRRHHESERLSRPDGLGRHYSGSSVRDSRKRDGNASPRSLVSSHARYSYVESETSREIGSVPTSPTVAHRPKRRSVDLGRRRSDMDVVRISPTRQAAPVRSRSTTAIDMDLAYGDYHPSSINPVLHGAEGKELLTLVDKAKFLLDEANCAQHSVKAIIEHLQRNPDAMAAVALTLAEISNIAAKMAPGVLTALKGSAPAVFALLASPQFLIAAGVGIGVTVVMLGGYKIIKKIKAKNAASKEGSMDEALEIDADEINRINAWRRGIVASGDDEDRGFASAGTSVDGEFITPLAASMTGMETRQRLPAGLSGKERKKWEKKEAKKENKERKKGKKSGSSSELASEKSGSVRDKDPRKILAKGKKPSPLRRLLA